MKNNKNIIFILLGLLMPVMVQSQDANSVMQAANIELTKSKSLWFNTNNAAGLTVIPLEDFNEVSMGYGINNGNFRMSQSGKDENTLKFNTNGALNLGGIMLWGNFTYDNNTTKESRFNTNLFDPFRDMPYYVADTISSKWKRQSYDLNLKAASPILWNFLGFGCEVDYTSKTAAKQNDPRATNYYYSISVRPGFLFKVNDNHYFGLNGVYENLSERARTENSNAQQNQQVFIMRGLGNYSPGVIGSGGLGSFYYKGNKIGGAFQYNYNGAFNALLDVKYHYKVEDVFQSPSKPQRMGTTKQNVFEGNLQLMFDGDYTNKLTLGYFDKSTDGIEYIQVIDESLEVQQWVTLAKYIRSNYSLQVASLKYDFFAGSDRGYSWRAGVNGEYSNQKDEYFLPNSILTAENIFANVFAKKNFNLGSKSTLLFGLNAGYSKNLNGEYIYGGVNPESVLVTNMFKNDIAFLTSDYLRFGGELNVAFVVAKKMSMFVSAQCQYLKPSSEEFSNRMNTSFSVGLTF